MAAANDSGVDSSNDSVESAPPASIGINIAMPKVMPPTPTCSPNTQKGEWPQIHQNAFQLSSSTENFALPTLPPMLYHADITPRSRMKMRICRRNLRSNATNLLAMSNSRRLRTAASTCNTELLTRMLEAGADPNAADEFKRSPLHLAACRGYIQIVQTLLKYRANPNVVDTLGNTPLHLAVISASSNNFNVVVSILLQGGASVHMYDRNGKTPLELAQAKLRILRDRYDYSTPESAQILEDMCKLTTLILRYMVKQQRELEDLSALEERLQNLSTSDDQDKAVSQAADELLASVERLSINSK